MDNQTYPINKADKYFIETLKEIKYNGTWSKNPRTKWSDGSPAHYKKIIGKNYVYNISKGEFPIQTLRKTAFKGAFYDIEAIYIKQTNIIEEMHESIRNWWMPFAKKGFNDKIELVHTIGRTYGHTVRKYDLVNKALEKLVNNPDDRRIIINLWQEDQMEKDPFALPPCAFMTQWFIREEKDCNYLDFILNQRSQDYLMTVSINPTQYVMLAMMFANHLTFVTGKKHQVGILHHQIGDVHIYNRHMEFVDQLLLRKPVSLQPKIKLLCEPKDFYNHSWSDFKIEGDKGIKPLSGKIEIAI